MDVLADILGSLRLTGAVAIDAETSGEYCLFSQFRDEDCERFGVRASELIAYHYIRSGRLEASVDEFVVEARAGDIILLPRNDPHLIYSRTDVPPVDSRKLIRKSADGPARITIEGGSNEGASFYCGFLGVSTQRHPLLDSLPPILKLSAEDPAGTEWVESSMRLLNEGRHSPEMVARLSELFFAEAIRRYMDQLPPSEGGWLAGLRDAAVARALGVIHRRYAEELTIEALAREAGVSRTVLGERFVQLIGEPPMRYCARWRMRMAANMLRDGRHNTANIAYAVGFNSEAAFNRAFKREFGEPPATWRRQLEARIPPREADASSELPKQVVRYCTARDGTRLAYSVVGEGPPLVKSANWLNHIEHDWESPVWRHWLRALTRNRCPIRYDERGNGLSDWDTPEISFEAFVDDLETVVDAAGLEQFDLLGISQGAAVAVAYAVRHPERVRKLVLCGGYAMGWAIRKDPEESARREAMITLSEAGWGADNPAYRQLFTNLYIPGASLKQQQWFNEVQKVSASPENAVKLQRALSIIDVRQLLPKVTTPTIVFHARGDQVVPFAAGEYVARRIPGATFVPLESDNHILLDSDPAWLTFTRGVDEFLDAGDARTTIEAVAAPAPPIEIVRGCTGSDGTRVAYAVSGEGFPMVKAPNWMTHLQHDWTSPVYGHWLEECAKGRKLVRQDLRGFGMSEWEPPHFDFESMVGDLAAVVDAAEVEQFDLLGVSHGAAFAIAYAARHPERVRKLILVNSFAAGWRVRADPEEIAWRQALLEMNQRRPSFRRSLLGEMFITLYFPSASSELIRWHNEHFEILGPVRNMEPMIELASLVDVRSELAKVRAQTLVCHARLDGNAPVEEGRKVAQGIAGSRFVELDSANHVLLGDEPAWPEFVRELRAFLRE